MSYIEVVNPKRWTHRSLVVLGLSLLSGCSSNDSHTTATTHVSPPPVQILAVINKPITNQIQAVSEPTADPKQPLLLFNLESRKTFRSGEDVPFEFSVLNAKLKGDGGDFRVRYIVDDDDMKWLDTATPFWLSGWIPGKHTIRVELIGPDGWPYKNGNANIVTREIEVK